MALPKIKHPTYAVTIPSTQQKVNIKPFTVQEEKLLLMARSSENTDDIINSVKQIITNCVIEPIDVDKLSTFDIEYLFIKLRAKSVGEIVDLEYSVPDTSPAEVIKFKVNLDEVEVQYNPDHKNKFFVYDNVGILMRYPSINEVRLIEAGGEQESSVISVLKTCIDKIFDNDTVYTDFTEQELDEFINSLPIDSIQKIKDFFDTMPSVVHEVIVKSKKGKEYKVVLKGINNFFT